MDLYQASKLGPTITGYANFGGPLSSWYVQTATPRTYTNAGYIKGSIQLPKFETHSPTLWVIYYYLQAQPVDLLPIPPTPIGTLTTPITGEMVIQQARSGLSTYSPTALGDVPSHGMILTQNTYWPITINGVEDQFLHFACTVAGTVAFALTLKITLISELLPTVNSYSAVQAQTSGPGFVPDYALVLVPNYNP